jgi:hypothetical protein
MANELFHERGALSDHLERRKTELREAASSLSASQIEAEAVEELAARIVRAYSIEPIAIDSKAADYDHEELHVCVRDSWPDSSSAAPRTTVVPGKKLTVRLPFSGPGLLFKLRPSTHTTCPQGHVFEQQGGGGHLLLEWKAPADVKADKFNQWLEEQVALLQRFVDWTNRDVEPYNSALLEVAKGAVARRRTALKQQGQFLESIVIPLRKVESAPSVTPIPMPKRIARPLPASKPVEPQYVIREDDYEFILKILRHESRSFEQMPATFRKLGEEDLRSVILAHLNGHFHGDAAAERFRGTGKTDICIEFENRAAFVAECKVWTGPKSVLEALDQLAGYLTWRDCRASMVLFNTHNKSFSRLQESMREVLQGHARFLREVPSGHAGEWRIVVKAKDDDARLITVHVFLADLSK